MTKIKSIAFLISLVILMSSCEIVHETTFEPDGSGKYNLDIDLTEMAMLGNRNKGNTKQIDTLIIFSDFLEEKKDSISKLSPEKQATFKQLENYSLEVKIDSLEKRSQIKIGYSFKDVSELKLFTDRLMNTKTGYEQFDLVSEKTKEATEKGDYTDFISFNKYYDTSFKKRKFSVKINSEGLKQAGKQKDENAEDKEKSPMLDLIKFKLRYVFPKKIKNVDNDNAKISPNFKEVEISGNLYEININPHFFDTNIEFERR